MPTTLAEARRRNLEVAIKEAGGPAALANLMGLETSSFLSQLTHGHRRISDKTSRKVEEATGRPMYWMDEEHQKPGTPAQARKVDIAFVGECVRMVRDLCEEMGADLSSDKMGRIVEILYADALQEGRVNHKMARELIELTI